MTTLFPHVRRDPLINRLKATLREYPRTFWVVVVASFVDGLGRTIILPFFALYVTQRFDVGMTQAGILFAIFSVAGFAGNMMGGGLTDRLGRKGIILFGLVISALSSLTMGLVSRLSLFFLLAGFVGFLSDVAGPAHTAMVADLLPERQRAEGFGILRVVGNLSWIVGPTIGGFLALHSFYLLFVLDALCSLTTAAIVFRRIPETRPEARLTAQRESVAATFADYRRVLADGTFAAFLAVSSIMNLVYLQLYSTLSVYLRDVHGCSAREYGYLVSLNATMVVLLQFWITRLARRFRPMVMMALGSALYLLGFTMYGLVRGYALFVLATLIVTVGEMVVIPVSQALVTAMAPEEMRGRYMATFGLSWSIPHAVGSWAAGLVLDNFNPNWVWYLAGMLSAAATAGFLALDARTRSRQQRPPL